MVDSGTTEITVENKMQSCVVVVAAAATITPLGNTKAEKLPVST